MLRKYGMICILLVLALSVILGACNSQKNGKDFFYKEKEINLPEDTDQIWDVCINEDGKMNIAVTEKDTKTGNIWESSDQGKTWKKKYSYTEKLGIREPAKVECLISLSPTGEAVCMVNRDIEDINKALTLNGYYIDAEGNSKEMNHLLPKSEVRRNKYQGDGFFSGAVADEENLMVTNLTDEVYLIDKNTNEVTGKVLEGNNVMIGYKSFMMEKDTLHVVGDEEAVIYDIAAKKVIEKNTEALKELRKTLLAKASDPESAEPAPIMTVKDNCYYLMHKDGITKFDNGNKEDIIPQSDMTPIPMETYSERLLVDDKENIYLAAVSKDGTPMLLFYEKQEGVKPEPEKSLNVYTLKEDEGVQKLADSYEKINQNVTVNVTVGMKEGDRSTVNDTVKKLNTRMMGGDGPDVIFLDGIDAENYIDNDMLIQLDEDITGLDKENMLNQVVNTYEKDGKLYAIPVRFGLPVTISKDDDVINARSSTEFVDKLAGHNRTISEYAFPEFARYFYQVFLDYDRSRRDISKESIKTCLQEMKKLKKMEESGDKVSLSHLMLPPTDYSLYMEKEDSINVGTALSRNDLTYFKSLDGISYGVASDGKNVYYVPRYTAGISSFSENKEEGKEFISYLLSEKGQKIYGNSMGFSINKTVLRDMLGKGEDVYITDEDNVTVKMPELSGEDIDHFIKKAEQVNMPANNNSIIMSILLEYAENYLNDKISLEEAVSGIEERLEMYKNE